MWAVCVGRVKEVDPWQASVRAAAAPVLLGWFGEASTQRWAVLAAVFSLEQSHGGSGWAFWLLRSGSSTAPKPDSLVLPASGLQQGAIYYLQLSRFCLQQSEICCLSQSSVQGSQLRILPGTHSSVGLILPPPVDTVNGLPGLS